MGPRSKRGDPQNQKLLGGKKTNKEGKPLESHQNRHSESY